MHESCLLHLCSWMRVCVCVFIIIVIIQFSPALSAFALLVIHN